MTCNWRGVNDDRPEDYLKLSRITRVVVLHIYKVRRIRIC